MPSGCLRPGQCVIRIPSGTENALFNASTDQASGPPVDANSVPHGLWLHNLLIRGDAADSMATAISKQAAASEERSAALWLTAVTIQGWRTSLNLSGTAYAEGTPLALVA